MGLRGINNKVIINKLDNGFEVVCPECGHRITTDLYNMVEIEGNFYPEQMCTIWRNVLTGDVFADDFCGCGECTMDSNEGAVCETCTNQKVFNDIAKLSGMTLDKETEDVVMKLNNNQYFPQEKYCGDCDKRYCDDCIVANTFKFYTLLKILAKENINIPQFLLELKEWENEQNE